MQLISRDKLFKLGGTSSLSEDEKQCFNYTKFKTEWRKTRRNIINTGVNVKDQLAAMTYKNINKWLQENYEENSSCIKYVGEGSSRAAYALEGGKCLKLAMYVSGIAQNQQEVNNYNKAKDHNLKCFTQIYDHDKSTFGSILTECCAPAERGDFTDLYGLTFEYVVYELLLMFNSNNKQNKIKKYKNVHTFSEYMMDNASKDRSHKAIEFWKNCLTNTEIQWDILRDLLSFYIHNNNAVNELLIDDLTRLQNWGLVWRTGHNKSVMVPVILDYGFSKDIYDTHYKT